MGKEEDEEDRQEQEQEKEELYLIGRPLRQGARY